VDQCKPLARGIKLPVKLEPECALLLRTTEETILENMRECFGQGANIGGKGSRANGVTGMVLPFNYEVVDGSRAGAYTRSLLSST